MEMADWIWAKVKEEKPVPENVTTLAKYRDKITEQIESINNRKRVRNPKITAKEEWFYKYAIIIVPAIEAYIMRASLGDPPDPQKKDDADKAEQLAKKKFDEAVEENAREFLDAVNERLEELKLTLKQECS